MQSTNSDPENAQRGGRIAVLGIETSCDETAASVVVRNGDGKGEILSNVVRSQWQEHGPFGGVVPEIAARAHAECLDEIIKDAMLSSGLSFEDLDGVAATAGPGLNSGLIVGLISGKAIALAHGKPLMAINHLEAHALTVGLTEQLQPPYLLLLISGGHTQLLSVNGVGTYERLGTTIDDALGEAFDKTAKLLGLEMPGGPSVEAAARKGDPKRFAFPRPMAGRPELHFSFAGLKTAVRQKATALQPLSHQDIADICASFQAAVAGSLADRLQGALKLLQERGSAAARHLVVAGGAAANQTLAQVIRNTTEANGCKLSIPPASLCGDNAAMIAWAGAERLRLGLTDGLDFAARPRWPLDEKAPPASGAGVKA